MFMAEPQNKTGSSLPVDPKLLEDFGQEFWSNLASYMNVKENRWLYYDDGELAHPAMCLAKVDLEGMGHSNQELYKTGDTFEKIVLQAKPEVLRPLAQAKLNAIYDERHAADAQWPGRHDDLKRYDELVWWNVVNGGKDGKGESLMDAVKNVDEAWGHGNHLFQAKLAFGKSLTVAEFENPPKLQARAPSNPDMVNQQAMQRTPARSQTPS